MAAYIRYTHDLYIFENLISIFSILLFVRFSFWLSLYFVFPSRGVALSLREEKRHVIGQNHLLFMAVNMKWMPLTGFWKCLAKV
jgi:hypothetical protein